MMGNACHKQLNKRHATINDFDFSYDCWCMNVRVGRDHAENTYSTVNHTTLETFYLLIRQGEGYGTFLQLMPLFVQFSKSMADIKVINSSLNGLLVVERPMSLHTILCVTHVTFMGNMSYTQRDRKGQLARKSNSRLFFTVGVTNTKLTNYARISFGSTTARQLYNRISFIYTYSTKI